MCISGRLFYPAREAVLFEARPPPCGRLVPNHERPVPNREPHYVVGFAVSVALAEPRPLFFG